MSFETKNFKVFKKYELPKNQREEECTGELEGDVRQILSASSNIDLISHEVLDGEINYVAEISNCVIYATDDFRIGSANFVCEIAGKIQNNQISLNDKAILTLTIKETKVFYENGNAVVKSLIEECGEIITTREVKNIDSSDDDVCTKKEGIIIQKFVGEGLRESQTEEEFSARAKVKKIVSVEPSIVIKNVDCENGSVTVSGETITRIIYLTEEDKFESNFVNVSFKEEIEIENCEQGSKAFCKPYIKSKDCLAEVLESDKGTKISIKVPFKLNTFVCCDEEVQTIEDVYSTETEIKTSSESFDMTKMFKTQLIESKIDGSLTLSDEKPRVDKIIFNGGNSISVTNSYVQNKELFVEGIAKTVVVYLNDEEGSLNSVEVEIPFVLSEKIDAGDDAVVCADAIIYDTDVSVRKGRELFFDGKVKANARVCESEVSATIVQIDRGEHFAEKDFAMQYVFGKAGENLWDIAKRNKVKQEQIIVQNQDVTFPLIQDTGFILFFQKLM